MNLFEAVLYGIIQGITEFLPISSSGHLVLLPWFLGREDPGLAFDVALHWGTLLGVVIYYRQDLIKLLKGFLGSFRGGRNSDHILPWKIGVATIPGALMGYFGEPLAETFFRSPWVIATQLIIIGGFLWWADRQQNGQKELTTLTWGQAILIGVAQGVAIIPGTSRSGITIMAALFLGLSRGAAVRFSFLLAVPIILGAGILKIDYLITNLKDPGFCVGIFTSALAGYGAIHFLVSYIRQRSFTPFVIYRFALAAVIITTLLIRA